MLDIVDNLKWDDYYHHLSWYKDEKDENKLITICLCEGLWNTTSKWRDDNKYVSIDEGLILALSPESALYDENYDWIIYSSTQSSSDSIGKIWLASKIKEEWVKDKLDLLT